MTQPNTKPQTNGTRALVVIDYINEIVDPSGKLASKGYAAFIQANDTFERLNMAISAFRSSGDPVIFVRLAFASDYSDQPKGSPVFGRAHEFGILSDGTWSSEIHEAVDFRSGVDIELIKTRVSAFYNTQLLDTLHGMGITNLYLAGVATDLAVEAAARDAHDRDFTVTVVHDACAAATLDDHNKTLGFLPKVSRLAVAKDL